MTGAFASILEEVLLMQTTTPVNSISHYTESLFN